MNTKLKNSLDPFKIGFTGDVMLGRLVNDKITYSDYRYPWGDMLFTLKNTDLNIINLESALTRHRKKVRKVFNFRATPDKVQTLKEGNIHVVNLANNHILDFSTIGLLETIEVLDHAGIKYVGAGKDWEAAGRPVVMKVKNTKIGIIGGTDNEPAWRATERPGTNYVDLDDCEVIKKQVANLKANVDLVIVSIHWGPNMREKPPPGHVHCAHELIDAGADIIHGHSAHIFQGIEIYRGKLIMYDTGDFIDDYVIDSSLHNDRSFFFQCEITGKRLNSLKLIPVVISDRQVNHADGPEAEWAWSRMKHLSTTFNTEIKEQGVISLADKRVRD